MKAKATKRELLLDDFYQVERVHVEQGKEQYTRLLFKPKNAIVVLVKHIERDSFFFVKQMRTCIIDEPENRLLELPAGMIENEEFLEETVIRECEEEIGFKPFNITNWGWAWSAPGIMTEKMHYFYAEVNDVCQVGSGGGLDTEHENIEVLEIPISKTHQMLMNHQIEDAKSMICLQRYFLLNALH